MNIVKIIIECSPIESYLKEVYHTFIFEGEFFEDCDNIEEIRDKFYKDLSHNYIVKYINIYTYLNEVKYRNKEFEEYLGE